MPRAPQWRLVGEAAARVANENAQANKAFDTEAQDVFVLRAMLGPRQAFAGEVEATLQGGRAAILTPESRDSLLRTAQRLGLRTFDAHLVIATVQDAARRGERAWLIEATRAAERKPVQAAPTRRSPIAKHAATEPALDVLPAHDSRPTDGIAGQALIAVTLALVVVASVAVLLGS